MFESVAQEQEALLAVKTPASPDSNGADAAAALVNAELMKDSKHCVITDGAAWNGPTNEPAKKELMA
eukprot:1651915-Heterocapsa_arctica.AAC.1